MLGPVKLAFLVLDVYRSQRTRNSGRLSKKALGGEKMELVEDVKEVLIKTAIVLKGSERRLFMARTVRALGKGGQCLAERE